MKEITKSASKIVFLVMAFGAVIGFFMSKLSEQNFMQLVLIAFTFYFANKGDSEKKFLGK